MPRGFPGFRFTQSGLRLLIRATPLRLLSFLEAELLERRRVFGTLGGVQDFDADNAAFLVVVHDDAIGDLFMSMNFFDMSAIPAFAIASADKPCSSSFSVAA